jgi:hypothetical protein
VGAVQLVEAEGRGAGSGEGVPGVPLGLPHVDDLVLHVGGETLVQPQAVPPLHGGVVTEPHVSQFVRHHVGNAFLLTLGGRGLVAEQVGLAIDDAAQVLHGAGSEVGHGDEVDLVTAVVADGEVVFVGAEGEGSDLLRELELVALARGGVEAQLLAVDLDRAAEFQLTGRESQVVGFLVLSLLLRRMILARVS